MYTNTLKFSLFFSLVLLITSCNQNSISNETMINEKAQALAEEMVAEKLAMMEQEKMAEMEAMKRTTKPTIYLGSREYTLAIAEAMPADMYTYKPNENVKTFGEQLTHAAMAIQFFGEVLIKGNPMPTQEEFAEFGALEKEIAQDKDAVIQTINDSFDYIEEIYANMSAEDFEKTFKVPFDPNSPDHEMIRAFDFITAHITHHRGQAATYLRMNNITPPGFSLY